MLLIPKEHELFILIADIKSYSFHVIFVITQLSAAKEPSHDYPPGFKDLCVVSEF